MANLLNPWYNGWRPQQPPRSMVDSHGIASERGWYHDAAALTALDDTMWVLANERRLDENSQTMDARRVLFWDFLGYQGYGEGPSVHVVGAALADPLLARLPMSDLPTGESGILKGYSRVGIARPCAQGKTIWMMANCVSITTVCVPSQKAHCGLQNDGVKFTTSIWEV